MDGEFTLTRNQTIYVRLTDNAGNYGGTATSNPNKIDTVAPTVSGVTVESTTTSTIKVTATATDATATTASCQSGVYSYSFYNSKTNTWSNYQTSSSYTFSGLSSGTNYTIKVKAKDKAGNISGEKSITATTVATYTITYNTNGGSTANWTGTKTQGVTYNISTTKPSRADHIFLGWSTNPSSTTVGYKSGATLTTNANTTLYAVWQPKEVYFLPVWSSTTQHPNYWNYYTDSSSNSINWYVNCGMLYHRNRYSESGLIYSNGISVNNFEEITMTYSSSTSGTATGSGRLRLCGNTNVSDVSFYGNAVTDELSGNNSGSLTIKMSDVNLSRDTMFVRVSAYSYFADDSNEFRFDVYSVKGIVKSDYNGNSVIQGNTSMTSN